MTKEEVIESMIESRKKGLSTLTWSYCLNMNCDDCPFHGGKPICSETMILMLVDRLIKAEESQKAETNFDHYVKNHFLKRYANVVYFELKDGWEESFNDFWTCDYGKWLKSPYKSEPKYKLSKVEYDLLKAITSDWGHVKDYVLNDYRFIQRMANKGYFKDIPLTTPIKDVLDDCEVVEE